MMVRTCLTMFVYFLGVRHRLDRVDRMEFGWLVLSLRFRAKVMYLAQWLRGRLKLPAAELMLYRLVVPVDISALVTCLLGSVLTVAADIMKNVMRRIYLVVTVLVC